MPSGIMHLCNRQNNFVVIKDDINPDSTVLSWRSVISRDGNQYSRACILYICALTAPFEYQAEICHFVQLFFLFYQDWTHGLKSAKHFVEMYEKCSKALLVYKFCVYGSLAALKMRKITNNNICSLGMMHQIILHKFTSTWWHMVLHHAEPQGTTVLQSTAWCTIWCTTWYPTTPGYHCTPGYHIVQRHLASTRSKIM